MSRSESKLRNVNGFMIYSLSILLATLPLSLCLPPYIPGEGLTNEIDGLAGEEASIHVYEKRGKHSKNDPNACQEAAAARYLSCDWTSRYRTMDGTCNNPLRPFTGALGECFRRLRPAVYRGRSGIRRSVSGGPLPEPRQLSLRIFTDVFAPAPRNISMVFVFLAQYLAHDTALTDFPIELLQNDTCCDKTPRQLADFPECLPMRIPPDDPFYSKYNITCLDFLRGITCASCGTGKREFQNRQTAAIDASITYGPTLESSRSLRTLDGTGRLKSESSPHAKDLLPRGRPPHDLFCPDNLDSQCFKAGDPRVNQNSYLTTVMTIFMREHNRIANLLKQLNPEWGEETLFQESRRLVIAQLQCITFRDFLPLLLGRNLTAALVPPAARFDPAVPLRTHLESTGAAFRLHSMVASGVGVPGRRFADSYVDQSDLRGGRAGAALRGACRAPAGSVRPHLSTDTTDHLYQLPGEDNGLDLASIDIQRGRDLGLPPYVSFLDGGGWTSFDQLRGLLGPRNVQLLRENYKHVRDVDLWVGVHMEKHLPGSLAGPVASKMVGEQFRAFRTGDRFFWENEGQFTAAQRSSLRRCSLARLLCDNTGVSQVPRNALLTPSPQNPEVDCSDIPSIDLSPWKVTIQ